MCAQDNAAVSDKAAGLHSPHRALTPAWCELSPHSGNRRRRFGFRANHLLNSFPGQIKFENRGPTVYVQFSRIPESFPELPGISKCVMVARKPGVKKPTRSLSLSEENNFKSNSHKNSSKPYSHEVYVRLHVWACFHTPEGPCQGPPVALASRAMLLRCEGRPKCRAQLAGRRHQGGRGI